MIVTEYVADRLRLREWFPGPFSRLRGAAQTLCGDKEADGFVRTFVADLILKVLLVNLLLSAVGAAADEQLFMLAAGAVLSAAIVLLAFARIKRAMVRRKQLILLELPEVLNKVTLLVNAGETVSGALSKCVEQAEQNEAKRSHPLIRELACAVNRIKNNDPLQTVLEDLGKRCGVPEASLFTTTLLLNYRRGGEHFVLTMRGLSLELWEKRKTVVRELAEEASAKLVFPMVLVFLVVTAVVAAPAIMTFN